MQTLFSKARINKEEQAIRKAFNKQHLNLNHQGRIDTDSLKNLVVEIATSLKLKQPSDVDIGNAITQIDLALCDDVNFSQFKVKKLSQNIFCKKFVKFAFKEEEEIEEL